MATEQNMVRIVERSIEAELQKAKAEIMLKLEKEIEEEIRLRIGTIILKTEQFYSVQRQGLDVIITLKNKVEI